MTKLKRRANAIVFERRLSKLLMTFYEPFYLVTIFGVFAVCLCKSRRGISKREYLILFHSIGKDVLNKTVRRCELIPYKLEEITLVSIPATTNSPLKSPYSPTLEPPHFLHTWLWIHSPSANVMPLRWNIHIQQLHNEMLLDTLSSSKVLLQRSLAPGLVNDSILFCAFYKYTIKVCVSFPSTSALG